MEAQAPLLLVAGILLRRLFGLIVETFVISKILKIKFAKALQIAFVFVLVFILLSYLYDPVSLWTTFSLKLLLKNFELEPIQQNIIAMIANGVCGLVISLFIRIGILQSFFKIKVDKPTIIKLSIFYLLIQVVIPLFGVWSLLFKI